MDPTSGRSVDFFPPGYLFPTDIAALDQIGWNIDRDNPPQPPMPDTRIFPANGTTPLIPVTLRWTRGEGATSHVVYVYKGPVNDANLVHRSEPIDGNQYTLTSQILDQVTTFGWFTVPVNDWAFVPYSPTENPAWTFQPRVPCDPQGPPGGHPCPGDANRDGCVDFNDIAWITANFGFVVGAAGPGDANGDGCVDFADITTVLANWLNCCH